MSTNLPPLMESRLAQALLEHSDLGVIGLDAEGRVAVWNEWMAGRTGIGVDAALQRTLEDLFPQLPSSARNEIQAALATGAPRVLSPVLHAPWLAHSPAARQVVRLLPWHEQGGMLILIQDVTGQLAYEQRAEEALRRTNRALRLLSECNQALIRATNENDLLQAICRNAVEIGGYRMAWVGFAEQDEAKSVRPVAQGGFEQGYLETLNITWADSERGRGPTGTAIRTGEVVIARNISGDAAFAPWQEAAAQRGYLSSIALPIVFPHPTPPHPPPSPNGREGRGGRQAGEGGGGTILGALNIYSAEADAFDEEEIALLRELADDLAFGLHTLRNRTALVESESRYRQLFDASPDAVFVLDPHGRFLDCNQIAVRRYGYTRQELLGMAAHDLAAPDLKEQAGSRVRQSLESGGAFEWRHRRRDGRELPVEISAVPITLGGLRGILASVRDISERKQAELALREQVQRTVRLLQTTLDGYILADTAGQVVDVNSAYCNLIGYTRDELLQMNIRQLEGQLSPQEIERRIELMVQQGGARFETQHRRKDGRLLDLDVSITIIQQQDGPLVAAFVRDITERKQAAEALRQSEHYNRLLFDSSPMKSGSPT
jgi:PAS domain S-box-containing protein